VEKITLSSQISAPVLKMQEFFLKVFLMQAVAIAEIFSLPVSIIETCCCNLSGNLKAVFEKCSFTGDRIC